MRLEQVGTVVLEKSAVTVDQAGSDDPGVPADHFYTGMSDGQTVTEAPVTTAEEDGVEGLGPAEHVS